MTRMTVPGAPAPKRELSTLAGYQAEAPALEVADLRVEFTTPRNAIKAVDGVSYSVEAGKTLAVIGESGSGKSITVRAVMGILPRQASITSGSIRLSGVDLRSLNGAALRRLRGSRIAMIFQDSLSALNPVLPVGYQIAELFRVHRNMNRRESHLHAVELLDRVRIPSPDRRARQYPHEFSGGMRQRAMIAMALALGPDVLIADEPTTALDVTVQAQIMELLADLRDQHNMALVLISHDMGVVADTADDIAVMYGGRIVEQAPAIDLYDSPQHPYTRALLGAIPRRGTRGQPLTVLQGSPPDLARMPVGCAFRPRCPDRRDICMNAPPLYQIGRSRLSACHQAKEVTLHD